MVISKSRGVKSKFDIWIELSTRKKQSEKDRFPKALLSQMWF